MSDETIARLTIRADELYRQVLGPLLVGGGMQPVRPVGPLLARKMSELASVFQCSDSALMSRCDDARVRRARMLAPIDRLPPPSAAEWMMLAVFNDLLQSANPRLPSVVAPSRPFKLLRACEALIAHVGPPADLMDAVARHATFARVFEVHRVDTSVRWWTGSAMFHGEPPSRRLTAWPDMRRVQITETPISVESLPLPGFPREHFQEVLGAWLALSPLTDLATAGRAEPLFRWGAATLGLVSTSGGRRLARRVLGGIGAKGDVALERATRELEQGAPRVAFQVATRFLDDRRAHAALSA